MQEDYIQRINKALTFIESHLDSDLSLHRVAEVACYSPFHLHRLFKAITSETLNAYVTRKRVEHAALKLLHHPELSVSDIAVHFGFKSDSVFSRTFKKIQGISPSDFRRTKPLKISKNGQVIRNFDQIDFISEDYLRNILQLKNWIKMNATIEIKQVPAMNLAYLTVIGEASITTTFQRLAAWAARKGLLSEAGNDICRVFHDSFKVTDADKVRMSIGLRTERDMKPEGEISVTRLQTAKCFIGHFLIEPAEFEKAWDSFFIAMNDRGYRKAEGFPFEVYHNNYLEHPEKKCIVDFYIPIE